MVEHVDLSHLPCTWPLCVLPLPLPLPLRISPRENRHHDSGSGGDGFIARRWLKYNILRCYGLFLRKGKYPKWWGPISYWNNWKATCIDSSVPWTVVIFKISVVSQCRILVAVQLINTMLFALFFSWQLAPPDLVTFDADWHRLNLLTGRSCTRRRWHQGLYLQHTENCHRYLWSFGLARSSQERLLLWCF